MRYQGRISIWKHHQGFGYVVQNGGHEAVIVHIKDCVEPQRCPYEGDLVTYAIGVDDSARKRAVQVALVNRPDPTAIPPAEMPKPGGSRFLLALALGFLILLGAASVLSRLPVLVFKIYFGASLVCFFAYALDQAAAKASRWRIKAAGLHLLALVGGWPGAMLAQNSLRHSSRQPTFQAAFWITVLLNCAVLSWLAQHYLDGDHAALPSGASSGTGGFKPVAMVTRTVLARDVRGEEGGHAP